MKYIIKQDSVTKTVVVEASGIINTEVAKEMVLAAGAEINYTGFQKCLFDLTNTHLDSKQKMVEMYMFAEAYKKARINKSVKMAAVIPVLDGYRLYLERAANLKGYKLKHFKKQNDASNWLCLN
jgi:hypothetical protein